MAIFLVISVSVITYYSIRNLLDTVEELSEPNVKLRQMNALLADVYLLDMSKTERTSDRDSVLEETLGNIKEKLDWLIANSSDSSDIRRFEEIKINVSELLVVYAGLEEVRYNLTSRTFTEEALKSIETRIKRQEQFSDLQFLGRIRTRDLLSEIGAVQDPKSQMEDSIPSAMDEILEDEFEEIVRGIELQASQSDIIIEENSDTDLALEALKKLMTQMFQDEQRVQQDFITLENKLLDKNKEVFSQIQGLVSNMQRDLLIEYQEQNRSAYNLTESVSVILGLMVFLGIIGSLGFVYNILNEIKKANTYRERLEEAKAESDKLAKAKQDFLANMSHEIRNPIHVIQGYQNALDKSKLEASQKEYVQLIGFATGTLVGIVNDILDFSKLEAGKIQMDQEPFDPKRLIHAIKKFFAFKFQEKGLKFIWDIQLPEDKWLRGDALRINQILNNLLTNALKFTHNGEVQVSVIFKPEKILLLSVKDTGMGMSEEVRKNIFEEFNQGDTSVTRKYGGTGLGLSIVKKLVDLQNGTIKVESTKGVGTKFEIEIPTEEVAIPEILESSFSQAISMAGLRVLVVDDDTIGLKLIRLVLESLGAEVETYLGGKEFKNTFREKHYDLALLDIQMPEVSGWQVLKILKNIPQYESLKVIAMTANVFADEQNQIVKAGFDNLILKPFDEAKLAEVITNTIELDTLRKSRNSKTVLDISEKTAYDLTDLGKFCMGDDDMLLEVLGDIIQITTENLIQLELAVTKNDYSKILEITHQLSSRLGQIKSPLSEQAKNIETTLKAKDREHVLEDTIALIPGVKELLLIIQEEHDLLLKEKG